jgi:hypothetical protein
MPRRIVFLTATAIVLFGGVAATAIHIAQAAFPRFNGKTSGRPTQYVRKTSGPVLALAADGGRAAFIVEGRVKECMSVMVWDPVHRRIAQLQSGAAKCESSDRLNRRGMPSVALAGSRAAWLQLTGGNNLETIIFTATLARPKPVWLAYGAAGDGVAGTFVRRPVGDGSLIAFTTETRCHPDYGYDCPAGRPLRDIIEATVWRVGGGGPCPSGPIASPVSCSVVARADSELTVLAVDAGRIAVRTQNGVRLYTAAGRVLFDLEIEIKPVVAAAISGNWLVVRDSDGFLIYDARTGKPDSSLVGLEGIRLEDLQRGLIVTAQDSAIRVQRLGSGLTSVIRANRPVFGQLESPGLFIAGSRRVTFTPMREVLRRLG